MIPELIPIVDYDDLLGCFRLRDDRFLDIMQLECKNLATMSRDEKQIDILRYSKLYKTYSGDLKIVGINYPTDTTSQLATCSTSWSKLKTPSIKSSLSEKIREMEAISKNYFDREYFVFVFAADEAELRDNRNILMATLANGAEHLLRRIDKEKKIQLLSKINNKNTAFYRMPDETLADPKKLEKVHQQKGVQPIFAAIASNPRAVSVFPKIQQLSTLEMGMRLASISGSIPRMWTITGYPVC